MTNQTNPVAVKWDEIHNNHGSYLYRARVPGGWLVKSTADAVVNINDRLEVGHSWTESICFVPDPLNQWS